MTILAITGATGRIGTALRSLLAAPDRTLRLIDVVEPDGVDPEREEFASVSIEDERSMHRALQGADALVHLAGFPSEREWQDILETNISGTYVALEAAQEAGVRNVFLASSIHAVGAATLGDVAGVREPNPRPDTFYGVSKATMEALGAVFATRHDMSIVSARICHFSDVPDGSGRDLQLWVSPGDIARLVEATVALDRPGHTVVWAVSRNGAAWLSPEAGESIGFVAVDSSVDPGLGPDEALAHTGMTLTDTLGGEFLDDEEHPLGEAL
ncbi:NAD-dependent epimerase/dehydratase family protein [Planctomonas psychrotolerans]|uniref:NAD-dependent epimerase/dehydratase family protein n=1 Tax=Planctomonas psychrotolerans TaxID=2528712 RepID=UPI00123A49D0|nr:NAD(P)-dependent oxidoreductase [Planctomonas psychrotolerans]